MATLPNNPRGGGAFATATVTTSTDGLSDVIDLGGAGVRSIQVSTAWTAASMTFKASIDSSANMQTVRVSTACTELTYNSTANYSMAINSEFLSGFRFLQIRSGTAATPVAQAAARTIKIGLRNVDNLT